MYDIHFMEKFLKKNHEGSLGSLIISQFWYFLDIVWHAIPPWTHFMEMYFPLGQTFWEKQNACVCYSTYAVGLSKITDFLVVDMKYVG